MDMFVFADQVYGNQDTSQLGQLQLQTVLQNAYTHAKEILLEKIKSTEKAAYCIVLKKEPRKAPNASSEKASHQAHNNILETCFASIIAHRLTSSLIFCVGADSLRLNILVFLSFHTSQQTRIMMERSARLAIEGVRSKLSHQVYNDSPSTQVEGDSCSLPNHIATSSRYTLCSDSLREMDTRFTMSI